MQRKLTITVEESVYNGLYAIAGKRNISRFIESLVRPHIPSENLDEGYRAMAMDEEREREALEWAESTIGDVAHETR
jgi:predicted CopG family antitoxin